MAEKTIFEKILDREIPSDSVFEDEEVYAFRDIDPKAPVHVLVIPKRRVRNIGELALSDPQWAGRYMQAVARVAESLGLSDNGYRVVFNTGEDGGQSVDYLHAHILGGRRMSWPPG